MNGNSKAFEPPSKKEISDTLWDICNYENRFAINESNKRRPPNTGADIIKKNRKLMIRYLEGVQDIEEGHWLLIKRRWEKVCG